MKKFLAVLMAAAMMVAPGGLQQRQYSQQRQFQQL